MKKYRLFLILCLLLLFPAGCAGGSPDEIHVISREDGSGTRSAFVELFGVAEKNAQGETFDRTTVEAVITNGTSVMMTMVAGDANAVGYSSLGTLNDSVKAVSISGVAPAAGHIEDGSYRLMRPFYIATQPEVSGLTEDFIRFILSPEGQGLVEQEGYVRAAGTEGYSSGGMSGKLVVSGSSSVAPVMERLAQSYRQFNPEVLIEIQQSDSTTGMNNVAEGICDIGMASRELKQSELAKEIVGVVIARDGIAVIVNHENPLDDLTVEQVGLIFTGELTRWSELP